MFAASKVIEFLASMAMILVRHPFPCWEKADREDLI